MSFNDLNLAKPILQALERTGYTTPSPIQEKTIPLLLEGRDVIGIAQTGTGKTAAFAVPILQRLFNKYGVAKFKTPRALVLAPTRELAAQIEESFKTYGKFLKFRSSAVFGGVRIGNQIKTLQRGVDVLIATPGRLMDLMNQGKVTLDNIEFLVLDEADRMLDMGFLPDVKKIVSALPVERQSLFFSATMNHAITELTRDFLKNPSRVEITPESTPVDKIEQCVFFVDNKDKDELLLKLIKKKDLGKVLVFVGMKHRADKIVRLLSNAGIRAESIHGNKAQGQRVRALSNFKKGRSSVMVATDIAARGIDVRDITHVINYDLPNEPENYVHRIGRTARAGKGGIAYSFCCARDRNFLNQIERIIKMRIEVAEHKYHSVKAKSATGEDAKPEPRGRGRGGGRGAPRGRSNGRPRSNSDGSYRRPAPGPSGRPRRSRDDSRGRRPARGRDDSKGERKSYSRDQSSGRSGGKTERPARKSFSRGNSRDSSPRSGGRSYGSRDSGSRDRKPSRGRSDSGSRTGSRGGSFSKPSGRGRPDSRGRQDRGERNKRSGGPRKNSSSRSGGRSFGKRTDGRSRSGKSSARSRPRR